MFRLTLHNNPQHAQSHFVLGLAHSHQPGSPAGSERLEAFREAFCHWKAYSINTFFSVATMAKLWVRRSALATLPIKSSSDQQARAPKLNTNRHSGSSKGYRRSSLMWNTWVGKVFAHHITAKSYISASMWHAVLHHVYFWAKIVEAPILLLAQVGHGSISLLLAEQALIWRLATTISFCKPSL